MKGGRRARVEGGIRDRTTTHTVIIGDARSMGHVEDASVHLVLTSPPYWQLKDYGDARGQLGYHQTYEQYLAALAAVWGECARALHPGCRLVINIGDQFARAADYGRFRVIPIHADIIRACASLELDFMGSIIWQKVTTCNTTGGGAVMGSFPYPRNGIAKMDYEHILLFKKLGTAPKVESHLKEEARLTTEEWKEYFNGHWCFPGARQEEHIAVFPPELPRRLIRMFTFPGETVLDPFLGSGTTSAVARELGRSSVGYEIHAEFLPLIREKIGFGGQKDLFRGDDEFEVVEDATPGDVSSVVEREENDDSVRTRGGYGSVVRKGDARHREAYSRVRDVLDVTTFRLDSGVELRLAGVCPNERSDEGVRFFREMVRGKQVYVCHESGEESRVYLHLKNRTCVNSKLIRSGLADADASYEYRLRDRYLRYQRERETR